MIPDFNEDGNLPEGEHPADWGELMARFGNTPHRRDLLTGLRQAAMVLKAAGCAILYLDGSFVTQRRIPRDYDGCWDATGVDLNLVDPVLLTFSAGRAAQKAKYLGELFPAGTKADLSGRTFLQFFKTDKNTGRAKGIIRLDLRSLT